MKGELCTELVYIHIPVPCRFLALFDCSAFVFVFNRWFSKGFYFRFTTNPSGKRAVCGVDNEGRRETYPLSNNVKREKAKGKRTKR